MLISNQTSLDYVDYLKERNYDYIVTGGEYVNYREALEQLYDNFNARTVLTDSGGVLTSILIKEGLVGEVSLLVSPVVVGKQATNLFRALEGKMNLEFVRSERIRTNHLLVVYRVIEYSPVEAGQVPESAKTAGEADGPHQN